MRSTPLSLSAERAATGTTLLRVMLDAHRNICCGPELKVLPELARLYQMMPGPLMPVLQSYQNTADDVSQHLRVFVEGLVENLRQHSGKPRWAEKTPHNVVFMRELGQIFPDAQFLHVIRDGRDVGCSLVTIDWTDPTTGRKVDYIANIGNAARYWRQVVQTALRQAKQPELANRVLEVRYENLVQDTETTMKGILQFLHEIWDDSVLAYHELDR